MGFYLNHAWLSQESSSQCHFISFHSVSFRFIPFHLMTSFQDLSMQRNNLCRSARYRDSRHPRSHLMQVHPSWAKRSPDLAVAFQAWVRRARLYYGEVEAAAAVRQMDEFLEASSLDDRTAVLAELRRLHVMADPHR